MRDLFCYEVADSAPGFALDILEPQMRARVAAHLIRCPECRQSVSDMQDSAAELLGSADGADWERQEWTADEGSEELRPARRRFRMAVCVAAAAVLFIGTTLGPELGQGERGAVRPAGTGVLVADGQTVGTVQFYTGRSPIIEIRADHLPASGTVGVVLAYTDGTARRIGEIQVRGGRATWAGSEPSATTSVTSVVLVDSTLHPVASASVP